MNWLIWLAVLYVVVGILKAFRDVISYRLEQTWLKNTFLGKWLTEGFIHPKFDGWHTADFLIINLPLQALLLFVNQHYWHFHPLLVIGAGVLITFINPIEVFRFFYHFVFMKKEHRDYTFLRETEERP